MSLRQQSQVFAWIAALAVAAILAITGASALHVRDQLGQMEMAENTVKGVTQFRFLIMETILYGESRSFRQWRQRSASFRAMLASHRYNEVGENALLSKQKVNLETLARLYATLSSAASVQRVALPADDAAQQVIAMTLSSLFIVTQDMIDDAFELVRLNRRGLETSQNQAGWLMALSILVLGVLFGAASMVIRRRVLAPIAVLQHAMEQISNGKLMPPVKLGISNEIGFLANTFDAMTAQLEQTRSAIQHENAERRQAQAALQATVASLAHKSQALGQAQKELQTIIDHMPALVVYWDCQLLNRFANKAYIEWFGVGPDQMRGKHIREVIGPERYQAIESRLLSALKGNTEIFERTLVSSTGQTLHALFSYVPDIEGGIVKGLYGFVTDITPLKQAQAAQSAARAQSAALAQLQSLVDAATDFSIIATDAEGAITLFSKGAQRMLGYTAAEMVGQARAPVICVATEVRARGAQLSEKYGTPIHGFDVFVETARRGESESREWTYVRKDGTTVAVNQTVTAARGLDGAIIGFLGIAKDIRAEKAMLQSLAGALTEAQAANVAKSRFLANMSHEIRTPMNAIFGMLQLLQYSALNAPQRDYVAKTQTAAQSLLGLLNDILDFSKIDAGKMTLECAAFSIDGLMRGLSVILSSSVESRDVEVLFSVDPRIPDCLHGDALRLRQVLLNLAGNAIKFTTHGEVTISLHCLSRDDHFTQIEFTVTDTGIGIAPDNLATIFDEFSQAESSITRRFGGTGLGLPISLRLVALMQGHLTVESVAGVGSKFCFSVAFANAPPAQCQGKGDAQRRLPVRSLRILIVDDNARARAILLAMAASLGWQGDAVASDQQAAALLAQSGAPSFDVILIDWRMPLADGWQAMRHRPRLGLAGTVPVVIMLTQCDRGTLLARMQDEPGLANAFLIKPATCTMLQDAVSEAMSDRIDGVAGQAALERPTRLAGLRLLVVDDNELNRQVAQELLASEGAAVTVAVDGQAALAMVALAASRFDAVLMDIQMPDMDGMEATRRMRQDPRLQTLPIIAMSAHVMAADKDACLEAGMTDHIGKPIDIGALVQTLLRHCGARTPIACADGAAASQHAPLQGIDSSLALQRLGGNMPLYSRLARIFIADAAGFVARLETDVRAGREGDAANQLHIFKSAAGTVGATALEQHAATLEARLRVGGAAPDIEGVMVQMTQLAQLVEFSLAGLSAIAIDADAAQLSVAASGASLSALGALLDQLDALLSDSNMRAVSMFAVLDRDFHALLGARLAPLAASMASLDFKAALACSARLRGELR